MPSRTPTRRIFCFSAAAVLVRPALAETQTTRVDVAALDHDRILSAAAHALNLPVTPITTFPASASPATSHDFYSDPGFTAHTDAIFTLGATIAALVSASVIAPDPRYAAKVAEHLRAWFLTSATRMNPSLDYAHSTPNVITPVVHLPGLAADTATGHFEGILEGLPLAEVARSLRFLSDSLPPTDLKAVHAWFNEYLEWLTDSRLGGLARDQRDHHASSWLFQSAAIADANVLGLTSDDAALNILRRRFHTVTLRAQIAALGNFPREVSSPAPYRNSLLNLDLLTLAASLLTTRFDNAWEYELQDGPGMRAAVAWHYPFLLNRSTWPYPADPAHFHELPGRRISMLLAGRAYRRPEYTDLFRSTAPPPETAAPDLLRSFPISQPILWITQPKAPSV